MKFRPTGSKTRSFEVSSWHCQPRSSWPGQPCKSLWFEMILFLDFVNPLTGSSVSVYLHLSVGQFMTRAPSWSLKWLQDLKFDWLQVQLTFRLVSPVFGSTSQLRIKWLLKWGHFSRSLELQNFTYQCDFEKDDVEIK